jgi:hypothetical protein
MGPSRRVLSAAGLAALLLSAVACGGAAPAASRNGDAAIAPPAREGAPSKVYSFGAMVVLTGPGAEIGTLAERASTWRAKRVANRHVVGQLKRALDAGVAYEMVAFLQLDKLDGREPTSLA